MWCDRPAKGEAEVNNDQAGAAMGQQQQVELVNHQL
jgi:hypothetical protein